jgi:hypothetical protein
MYKAAPQPAASNTASAARKLFVAAVVYSALLATHQISHSAGPLVSCLGAVKKIAPPGGALCSATGAGPSWVGGTRAMPSGEIWGGNGPAAGALNRAYHMRIVHRVAQGKAFRFCT